MKIFKFHAKQGQHNQIARLLTDRFGKPRLTRTNNGVLVTLILPPKTSKRTVDRYLYVNNVKGAVYPKNRFRIFKDKGWLNPYDMMHKMGLGSTFILSRGRKLFKARVVNKGFGCDCCGTWQEIEVDK